MHIPRKNPLMWLFMALMAFTLGSHAAQAQTKHPSKGVLTDGLAAQAKQAGGGPYGDGLWHVAFGSQVDSRGCVTVDQMSVADDDRPLYVCRDGKDDRFHAIHGSQVGEPFVRITSLAFKNGQVEYLGQAEDGTWSQVKGQNKTPASAPPRVWGTLLSSGHVGYDDDSRPSMPPLPERDACGIKVRGSQYILANGDPLVVLRDYDSGKQYVCWGRDKGPFYKAIDGLEFEGGHVWYFADTDDGLTHIVKDKQVGKGYAEILNAAFDGHHAVYRAFDGNKWHIVQDTSEGPPFDEMGTMYYSWTSHKPLYAARRSPPPAAPGQGRL